MNGLKPNEQRAKIAISTIWVTLIITAIILTLNIVVAAVTVITLNSSEGYLSSPHPIVDIISYIGKFLGYLYLFTLLLCVISFIRWFRIAYHNLEVLTGECMYDNSWTVKGCLIPFLNLYRPYEMMKELYQKTDRYLFEKHFLTGEDDPYAERLRLRSVKRWWISVILFSTIFFLSVFLRFSTLSHNDWIFTYSLIISFIYFLNVIFIIFAGIQTIFIIRNYQKEETFIFNILQKENEHTHERTET